MSTVYGLFLSYAPFITGVLLAMTYVFMRLRDEKGIDKTQEEIDERIFKPSCSHPRNLVVSVMPLHALPGDEPYNYLCTKCDEPLDDMPTDSSEDTLW